MRLYIKEQSTAVNYVLGMLNLLENHIRSLELNLSLTMTNSTNDDADVTEEEFAKCRNRFNKMDFLEALRLKTPRLSKPILFLDPYSHFSFNSIKIVQDIVIILVVRKIPPVILIENVSRPEKS